MFKRVLYPTDFSDVSRKALGYVKKLKEAGTEEVIVIHVIDWDPNLENLSDNLKKVLLSELENKAERELVSIETELKSYGFTVRTRIERGKPVRNILDAEVAEEVSAIVIGSHGKSNVKEILMGSVSENVIRRCENPVLVIKR